MSSKNQPLKRLNQVKLNSCRPAGKKFTWIGWKICMIGAFPTDLVGHRLPVWQPKVQSSKFKVQSSYYVGTNPPEGYVQVPDVLDTWFSSALCIATLGCRSKIWEMRKEKWERKNQTSHLTFHISQIFHISTQLPFSWLVVILFSLVARMIFSGIEFMNKEPFHTVNITPTIQTKEGKRMSKSLAPAFRQQR